MKKRFKYNIPALSVVLLSQVSLIHGQLRLKNITRKILEISNSQVFFFKLNTLLFAFNSWYFTI
jgi:hypothetical protein